ncbi:unnamed protein product [Rotaria magnacalcarata]|uniref:Uncharacterized protein n=1 Tax=Rotaria magnacalcarata TaxID=392030 RepID=A0A816YD62_9BILA|nr:unnamed protein product [Rotaria magnacalcarata]
MDTYGYLYTLPFIPSSPQSNLVVAKDDGGSQGNFQITVTFTVTQSMILVVTTYHPDNIGEFNISIHGPAQLSLTPYISASNTETNTNETTSVETTATTTITTSTTTTTLIITTATTVTTKVATKKSTKRTTRRTKKKAIRPTITTPTAVTATMLGIQSSYAGALTEKSSSFMRPKQGEYGFYFLAIKVKTSSSGIYTIVCKSGIDTYGCLYNESFLPSSPNSKLIATDDDSGSKGNFKLIANLTTTESTILVVTTCNAEQTGAFKVIVYGPEKTILTQYVTIPITTKSTSTTTSTTTTTNTTKSRIGVLPTIPANAKWTQNGLTVAGGNGLGNAINQLNRPWGLSVDDDQTVIIADHENHRIIQWKKGDTTNGQIVAGGKGRGNGLDQLNSPLDIVIDQETDSFIICDRDNRRVIRWSRRSGTTQGEILIDNIDCDGLAVDNQRYLYVSDYVKHEVRRYQLGEKNSTLVAGGNGQGDGLNQLRYPRYLFVDGQQNVFVSDKDNHRVMKWNKGAKEGIIVAGGRDYGNALTQFDRPQGLFVDMLGTLYVADWGNNRVMRWTQGAQQGTVVVGGNGQGAGANELYWPIGLSFDRHGNLYVVDNSNHRVQRFSIE